MPTKHSWILVAAILIAACGVSKDKVLMQPQGEGGSGEEGGSGGSEEGGSSGEGGAQGGQGGEGGNGGNPTGGSSGQGGSSGSGGGGGTGGNQGGSAGNGGSSGAGNGGSAGTGGGNAQTIYAIQSSATSTGCTANSAATIQAGVKLAPVVVVSPKFSTSSTLHGYYVQDPVASWPQGCEGKFTGALLIAAKSMNTDFVPGDLIEATVDYKEYYCMTELSATAAVKIGVNDIAPPVAVPSSVFAAGGTSAATEPYEGVVVKLSDLQVTNSTGGSDPKWWFQATGEIYVSNEFYLTGFTPANGTAISSLIGAVKYSYSKYLISPRTDADIVSP